MPWCDTCDCYLVPNALASNGRCRTCESEVDLSDLKVAEAYRAPWHFWLMVGALVLYLGWRLLQAVVWAFEKL